MQFKNVPQPDADGFFPFDGDGVHVFGGDKYDLKSDTGDVCLGAVARCEEWTWFVSEEGEELGERFDYVAFVRPARATDRISVNVSFTKAEQAAALAKLKA
ncbi:MAG: hypothetical protein NXI21_01870 [Alphaproteobacteria bacterium]|nr:hypothetical protein [Alphaproteobacteria bacterium]